MKTLKLDLIHSSIQFVTYALTEFKNQVFQAWRSSVFGLQLTAYILLFTACQSAPAQALPEPDLTLDMPIISDVGEPLKVLLSGDFEDGTLANISLLGSYGIWLHEASFVDGVAELVIPGEQTTQAGWTTVIAQAGESSARGEIELLPGPPTEPLSPLVGPRTITADEKSWSIMTVIPFDQYANPVGDGTQVTFSVYHPDNTLEEIEQETEHLLAWSRIFARSTAGKTFITTQSEDAFGKEVILHQTAGWPVPFTLDNEPKRVVADGLRLTEVRSTRIRDRFGNVIPDGTLVTFVVEDENGRQRNIPTQTVGGVAITQIQAPLRPERLKVTATVFAVESEPLFIDFDPGPAVGLFPIIMVEGEDQYEGSMVFEAGPLLGERDQYVPNGTPVLFILEHETGVLKEEKVLAFDGRAIFYERIENLFDGQYQVSAFVGVAEGVLEFEFEKR